MSRSANVIFASLLAISGVVGCSDGSDSPKPSESNKSASEEGSDDAKVGPQCMAYFECCEELASAQPSLAGACDSSKSAVADAIEKGASTTSYESACKQALEGAQSAGYCK